MKPLTLLALAAAVIFPTSLSLADTAADQVRFQATLNKIADAEKKRDTVGWTKLIRESSTADCKYVSPNGKVVKLASAIKSMKDQFAGTKSVATDTYTIKSYTPLGDKATAVVEYHAVSEVFAPDGSAAGKNKTSAIDSTLTLTFHLVKTASGMKTKTIDLGIGKLIVDGKRLNPQFDEPKAVL